MFVCGVLAAAQVAVAQESPDSVTEDAPVMQVIDTQVSTPEETPAAQPDAPTPAENTDEGTPAEATENGEVEGVTHALSDKVEVPDLKQEEGKTFNGVKLQMLDKVTARISVLEAPLGTVQRFGNLEIIGRVCWQSPPSAQPENAALLDISESKIGQSPKRIFTGWMFSSSPALSALENPVYDITVLECVAAKTEGL